MTWLVIITAGLGLNKYYPPKGDDKSSANFHTFTKQFDQHVTASPDELWYLHVP